MSNTGESVSVPAEIYERFKAAADKRGIPLATFVEAACADLPTEPDEVAALADRVWASMPQQSRTTRGG